MVKTRKTRTATARIYLTAAAFRQVEAAAFKNCRTVPQELTFMVESLLAKKTAAPARYDAPIPERYDAPESQLESNEYSDAPAPTGPAETGWTPEQEVRAQEAGVAKGLSEAQITAMRLIHKTPEAVLAAIEDEAKEVPA